ncbi:hypothetical protein Tco_1556908 [Tanacetum coccineum]
MSRVVKCALSRYVEILSDALKYLYPYRVSIGRVYPAYVDLETISQADRAQSSRVPVPLPDDPFVAIRQAQLVDTESEPEEAPSEEL